MKLTKILALAVIFVSLVSCGGSGSKISGDLTGKWQPMEIDLQLKGAAKLIASQVNVDDIAKDLLNESQKTGWLELKDDGTFVMMETADKMMWEGRWEFDGKLLSLAPNAVNFPIKVGVESLSDKKMKLDYATMAKSMMVGGFPENIPFMPDMKLIMTYKRVE